MDPNELSAPGYAIFRRPRSAVSARFEAVDGRGPEQVEARSTSAHATSYEAAAGRAEMLANGLANLEEMVDGTAATLEPAAADRLRAELARTGADLIDARFGDGLSDETFTSLRDTILALEAELAQARRREEADAFELKRLRDRTRVLTDRLHHVNQSAAADKHLVARLQEELAMLRNELAAANECGAAGAAELTALRTETADLQLALNDVRNRLLAQNREMEGLRVDNDLLRAKLSDTEALLRATHGELQRARQGAARTGQRLVEVEAENTRLNKANDALARDNARLEADKREQQAENDLMEQWLNGALARYAKLQMHTNELERQRREDVLPA